VRSLRGAALAIARRLVWWRFRLFQAYRHKRLVREDVAGYPILVLPGVFNPKLFRTGAFLAEALDARLVPAGARVLDLGTGSGIGAIAASVFARDVVATDLNPEAVRCARINVALNRVEDRVAVREGDLFGPVEGERFDLVLFNPPFFRGTPRDAADLAWRSPDVAERFAAGLAGHLTPGGSALVVLSSDGDLAGFCRAFRAGDLDVHVVARRRYLTETLAVYRLRPGRRR
jgi:HemK-related putative methylase